MSDIKRSRLPQIEYSAVQSLYWVGFCCINCFAASFLQNRGYSNTVLGLILALGNAGGFFIAPALASVIDRSKKITVFHCLYGLLLAEGITELLLIVIKGRCFALSADFVILLACGVAVSPLNTDLCFQMDRTGRAINFGAARGFGSLAYAIAAVLLGKLCASRSPDLVPYAGIAAVAIQLLILLVIRHTSSSEAEHIANYPAEKGITLGEFLKKHRKFCVFCFGSGLVMFASAITSSYMINIAESVGGDAEVMGIVSSVTAVIEMPMMLLYTRFAEKVRCSNAIKIAVICFCVRLLSFALISSIAGLYLTCLTEIFSYALLIPALVDYTSRVIGYEDMAKGQAVSAAMLTLGTIFAGQIGGIMLDNITVRATMYVCTLVCTVGAVICCVTVDSKNA